MNAPVLAKKSNSKLFVAIPPEMLENTVTHPRGGNGLVVVEVYPDEWSRVASISKASIDSQFFLVWSKLLTLDKLKDNQGTIEQPRWVTTDKNIPIHHTLMDKIKEIRADLSSGRKIIQNTGLVNAN